MSVYSGHDWLLVLWTQQYLSCLHSSVKFQANKSPNMDIGEWAYEVSTHLKTLKQYWQLSTVESKWLLSRSMNYDMLTQLKLVVGPMIMNLCTVFIVGFLTTWILERYTIKVSLRRVQKSFEVGMIKIQYENI